jgi:hypothetical protein
MAVYDWIYVEKLLSYLNLRPGGTTRGKWRILDRKVEWSDVKFEAPKVIAPACVD